MLHSRSQSQIELWLTQFVMFYFRIIDAIDFVSFKEHAEQSNKWAWQLGEKSERQAIWEFSLTESAQYIFLLSPGTV